MWPILIQWANFWKADHDDDDDDDDDYDDDINSIIIIIVVIIIIKQNKSISFLNIRIDIFSSYTVYFI